MEAKSVVIELYSRPGCNGSIEYYLKTINSSGVKKLERYNNENEAVTKMKKVLNASSCFRRDWHNLIRIEIEKQFLD